MAQFKRLNHTMALSAQITVTDVEEAARDGFRHIINNRPDGEESGQPKGRTIEAAAKAAGLGYTAIPVKPGGLDESALVAMTEALQQAEGPILAYCRTGTRSAFLWALSTAALGESEPDVIFAEAANAGYDLTPIMPMVDNLAKTHK
ncbi:MAG: TIGR01244 family sulfur transferase [Zymomonas mobilis subsp. pomaceae]|uniref:Beta-lactamase hydrolase-like protein phosphatase-like domain-containing protein n=1 Tax=Zymomonas mobilis subsp. pomaceae (strain ATCC 29192 / DSM 22645 / JCM 10191 / CCUG 17912 / NBRC 13757 / NCIMB 11200 / NRRL B-4491 / Barker I) TaxID=579138 RepID=F8EVR1_ZYMMT|nr:TIGR01244 family sulfur transferase [Zymomonas mobilis]AEI38398.1 protein of unknown function DUF442 [Zymomonas mobilis subsp. pomaceae ATCC 29192]MDX5948088.1 TIGR01244 family sulfur transferase [Zymomonas mobilis subsp. pomaceae]GEB89417.1 TIGR01244 family protein [Zymomonas mobilis subsp. pomaceae]